MKRVGKKKDRGFESVSCDLHIPPQYANTGKKPRKQLQV